MKHTTHVKSKGTRGRHTCSPATKGNDWRRCARCLREMNSVIFRVGLDGIISAILEPGVFAPTLHLWDKDGVRGLARCAADEKFLAALRAALDERRKTFPPACCALGVGDDRPCVLDAGHAPATPHRDAVGGEWDGER